MNEDDGSQASLHEACLLLGSNVQPEKNISLGLELLRNKLTILKQSSVWQSPSVGSPGPDFLNLAILVRTSLSSADLKEGILRQIETQLGRVRGPDKNAPRSIDIDIILFDGQLLDANLFVYAHRAVPVAELFPSLKDRKDQRLEEIAHELRKTNPITLKQNILVNSQEI